MTRAPLPRAELRRASVLLAFILALLALQIFRSLDARADQPTGAELLLHGPSYHFDRDAGHNNATYGVGYMFSNRIAIGAYRNSIDHTSVYAGYNFRITEHFGVVLGGVTGYDEMTVMPAAVLNVTVPVARRYRLHFNFVPFTGGFINLTLGYRL